MRLLQAEEGQPDCYIIRKINRRNSKTITTKSRKGEKRGPLLPVKIIPSPQEMDEFEKEEMTKTRPVVKEKLKKWYDWLINYVPKQIKNVVSKVF